MHLTSQIRKGVDHEFRVLLSLSCSGFFTSDDGTILCNISKLEQKATDYCAELSASFVSCIDMQKLYDILEMQIKRLVSQSKPIYSGLLYQCLIICKYGKLKLADYSCWVISVRTHRNSQIIREHVLLWAVISLVLRRETLNPGPRTNISCFRTRLSLSAREINTRKQSATTTQKQVAILQPRSARRNINYCIGHARDYFS